MDSVAVRLARGTALHEQCAEKAEPCSSRVGNVHAATWPVKMMMVALGIESKLLIVSPIIIWL